MSNVGFADLLISLSVVVLSLTVSSAFLLCCNDTTDFHVFHNFAVEISVKKMDKYFILYFKTIHMTD